MVKTDDEDEDENCEIIQNSPLNRATTAGNQRCIDILLEFMAKIPQNSSHNFSSNLKDLLGAHCFNDYFSELPFQTAQMQRK
jgi:hypothetical protein